MNNIIKLINITLYVILALSLLSCSEETAEEVPEGIHSLTVDKEKTGTLGEQEEAQYRFSVEVGEQYQVQLVPSSLSDDPDLLIFNSESQMTDYWNIVDANGGEGSDAAQNARVAKSDLMAGEIDKANFTALHNNDYFVMVSGPQTTSFSVVYHSSTNGYGCGEECTDRADLSDLVIEHSPENGSMVANLSTTISITFDPDFTFPLTDVNIEVFTLPMNVDNCRIDLSGMRCGFLSVTDSIDLMIGESVTPGIGSVNGNTVTFTLASELLAGHQYVVHIYADFNNDSFKTWWRFYT